MSSNWLEGFRIIKVILETLAAIEASSSSDGPNETEQQEKGKRREQEAQAKQFQSKLSQLACEICKNVDGALPFYAFWILNLVHHETHSYPFGYQMAIENTKEPPLTSAKRKEHLVGASLLLFSTLSSLIANRKDIQ